MEEILEESREEIMVAPVPKMVDSVALHVDADFDGRMWAAGLPRLA